MMISMPTFKTGTHLTVQKLIDKGDTGANIGSGKLDQLLASPALLKLMIEGASRLIDDNLPDGLISVGTSYTITHEQPTKIGQTLSCKVTVVEQIGNKIELRMETHDQIGLVSTGSCIRYIVREESVEDRANERIGEVGNGLYSK